MRALFSTSRTRLATLAVVRVAGALGLGLVVAWTTCAPGMLSADAVQAEKETGTIAGAWTLNKELSDDPAKVMADMQERRRSGGGGGGGGRMPGGGGMGGFGGGGGGRGGGRAGMDPEQVRERRETMTRALESPPRLTITQAEGTVTFTDGEGRSQTYKTTNKKEKHHFDNREVEIRTKWDDKRLVKETSLGDGLKLTETYVLRPEGRQLEVQVKLDGPRSLTLRRVYDAAS